MFNKGNKFVNIIPINLSIYHNEDPLLAYIQKKFSTARIQTVGQDAVIRIILVVKP